MALGNGLVRHVGLHRWHGGFPPALALLLWVADERAARVPTWVVLTCGCKDGAEVDVSDAPDEVKARASCERGRTGAAFTGMPWGELKGA